MREKKNRWSVKKKTELIARPLRGETMDGLSWENQVSISAIVEWRDKFIEGGAYYLKAKKSVTLKIICVNSISEISFSF